MFFGTVDIFVELYNGGCHDAMRRPISADVTNTKPDVRMPANHTRAFGGGMATNTTVDINLGTLIIN